MEECFGGNMIKNGKTIKEVFILHFVLLGLCCKTEEKPFHCHNARFKAALHVYNNCIFINFSVTFI
jgi:hypothetical protein